LLTTLYLGDDANTTDKILYAKNGDTNLPFLAYDESENEWVFSNDGTTSAAIGSNVVTGAINFIIDGGGSTITTGIKGSIQIPFGATITSVTLLADQTGSIVIDICKDTYANYEPTNADSITSSTPPTISSSNKSTDSTLTSWTTSVTAGDILRFNVDSITTLQRVTVSIEYSRT